MRLRHARTSECPHRAAPFAQLLALFHQLRLPIVCIQEVDVFMPVCCPASPPSLASLESRRVNASRGRPRLRPPPTADEAQRGGFGSRSEAPNRRARRGPGLQQRGSPAPPGSRLPHRTCVSAPPATQALPPPPPGRRRQQCGFLLPSLRPDCDSGRRRRSPGLAPPPPPQRRPPSLGARSSVRPARAGLAASAVARRHQCTMAAAPRPRLPVQRKQSKGSVGGWLQRRSHPLPLWR